MECMEVSHGIAETVRRCNVKVIAAYPITPQTHIVEKLSEYEGEFEFVRAESEFSALSVVMGASIAGVRVFTATASQGLALMHEALHNCAGLRLPVVMVIANRSLSSPISIWNDWQDSLSQRDTGWLQIYCHNAQQAVDFIPIMYYVCEKILLPGMVCIDGFYLTHSLEVFEIPKKEKILEFVGESPKHNYLNGVVGPLAGFENYQKLKFIQQEDTLKSIEIFKEAFEKFEKLFGRKYWFYQKCEKGSDTCIVTTGTLYENCCQLDYDVLGLNVFRPLPKKELIKSLENYDKIIVIEKDFSYGNEGIIASEIKSLGFDIEGIVNGLGGVDLPPWKIKELVEKMLKRNSK